MNTHDTLIGIIKASPPIAYGFAYISSIPIPHLAAVGTLIYTLILIGEKCYKFYKFLREKRQVNVRPDDG